MAVQLILGDIRKVYEKIPEYPSVWANIPIHIALLGRPAEGLGFKKPGEHSFTPKPLRTPCRRPEGLLFRRFLSFPTWDKNKYSTPRPVVKRKKEEVCLYKITKSDTGFKDHSVDCVITSPPYYRQRDYGVAGQIGQESSPEEYAKEIANVFKLLWSKLKTTATVFLNVGYRYENEEFLLVPELVAWEMKKVGYVLKNKIIWHKPNAMPTPARNRLNNTYEAVLFFVKNVGKKVYYFNLEEVSRKPKETVLKMQSH